MQWIPHDGFVSFLNEQIVLLAKFKYILHLHHFRNKGTGVKILFT